MESALIDALGDARETTIEVDGHPVHFTSLDKILWPKPGLTKRHLIAFYVQCSRCLLRTLRDRPLSVVRYPAGIEGQRIFQRHFAKGKPDFVETVFVHSDSNREPVEYILCNNLATLLWLGQMSAIELHPWHSRIRSGRDSKALGGDFETQAGFDESILNFPDYIVCDLDPNVDEKPFERARNVALGLKDLLAEQGLESFVKTSGKRGFHIYVPLARQNDFDRVRLFAEGIGRELEARMPDDVTLEPSLDKRPKKVFFDYSINSQAKTLACKLSPRAHPLATVSFPLEWERLPSVSPKDFTIMNAPRLIAERGDPWEVMLDRCQELPKAYVG
jgi:bifunctional non-homologous end joining protein LigD